MLLIAGGVGINPLISIMRHIADVSSEQQTVGRLVLLFSARSAEELIFQVITNTFSSL
jgi:ferredoxin-NADP reductase